MDLVHLVLSELNLPRPGTCRLLPGHTRIWPRIDSWRSVHLETLTSSYAAITWRKGYSVINLRLQKNEDDEDGNIKDSIDVTLFWNDPSSPEKHNHLHFAKMTKNDVVEILRRMNAPEDQDSGIVSRTTTSKSHKPPHRGGGRFFIRSGILPLGIGAIIGLAVAVLATVVWSDWKDRNRPHMERPVSATADSPPAPAPSPVAQALSRTDVRLIADLMRILDLVEKRQPIPEDVLNRLPAEVRETLMPMLRPITVPSTRDTNDTPSPSPSGSAPPPQTVPDTSSLPPVLPPETVPRDRFGVPMVPTPRP